MYIIRKMTFTFTSTLFVFSLFLFFDFRKHILMSNCQKCHVLILYEFLEKVIWKSIHNLIKCHCLPGCQMLLTNLCQPEHKFQ
jgi:hypothetical protein